jgi:predicted component of type VI protein secretion system
MSKEKEPMPAHITLTVTGGSLKGRRFVFGDRTWCTVGRASDCYLRLPGAVENSTASRYHCLLSIDPPAVRVRDLGSRNGTFVNGRDIGHRPSNQSAGEAFLLEFPAHDLKDGDEIRVGETTFRVNILAPALCAFCGQPIPSAERELAECAPDSLLCAACHAKADQTQRSGAPPEDEAECVAAGN